MEDIKEILAYKRIDNNDNKDSLNIDNSIDKGRYALKRGYVPRNAEAITAQRIAEELQDLGNFAYFYSAVKKIGTAKAQELFHETKADVAEGKRKGRPIRKPGALFNYKVKQTLKEQEEDGS